MAFAPAAEEIRNTSVTRRRGNWSDCGRQIWVSRAISAYLASLVGLVGASPISSQGLAFVRQIMRQILPLAARSTISLNIWQHESGPAEFCANVCFELEEFSLQEKLPESKTKRPFSVQLLTFRRATLSVVSCFKAPVYEVLLECWPAAVSQCEDLGVLEAFPGCN